MAEPDTDHTDPPDPDDGGTPRWVYVFGGIAVLLFLVFVVLHLAGGGFHDHRGERAGTPVHQA
jgi:hypothetical protein